MKTHLGMILMIGVILLSGCITGLGDRDRISTSSKNGNIQHTATPVLSIQSEDNESHNISIELYAVSNDQTKVIVNNTQELPADGRITYERKADDYRIRVRVDQNLVLNRTVAANVAFIIQIKPDGGIDITKVVV